MIAPRRIPFVFRIISTITIIIVAIIIMIITLKAVAALLNSSPAGSQSGVNFSFSGDVFKYFSAFFTCACKHVMDQQMSDVIVDRDL